MAGYKEILETLNKEHSFPEGLKARTGYNRFEDDSREGYISVIIGEDGDVHLYGTPDFDEHNMTYRFRTHYGGGCDSPLVRNALLLLAMAIEEENRVRPQHRGKDTTK